MVNYTNESGPTETTNLPSDFIAASVLLEEDDEMLESLHTQALPDVKKPNISKLTNALNSEVKILSFSPCGTVMSFVFNPLLLRPTRILFKIPNCLIIQESKTSFPEI